MYYQRALPSEKLIDCFAYSAKEIVGCCSACFYREMPLPDNQTGSYVYLMNIYTRPEFRSHGLGKAIVSWRVKQAKDRVIAEIDLKTSECGRPLYQKMGCYICTAI